MLHKLFPEVVSSSVLARYWYCAEESYINAVLGISNISKKVADNGITGHDWLEDRPKSKSWLNVNDKLEELSEQVNYLWFDRLGLAGSRFYRGTRIIAHPDDYIVYWTPRKISLVENKTITNPKWIKFLGPVARQQVLIGMWVFEPIFEQIGFGIADSCFVQYWKRYGMWMLNSEETPYNRYSVEEFLDNTFTFYRGQTQPIPPNRFKCRNCRVKQHCRIWRSEHEEELEGNRQR